MKILGRLSYDVERIGSIYASGGAYVAINAQSAYVESYNGDSIDRCDKFLVAVYTGNFRYNITRSKDSYLTSDEANEILKELVKNDYVDLDEHDVYFTTVYRFTSIEIANSWDDYDGEATPIKVAVVADETRG